MNHDRLIELIEAYGGNEDAWPEDEREAARTLLSTSEEARQLLSESRYLDKLLQGYAVEFNQETRTRLTENVMAKVQPDLVERLINWLLPDIQSITTSIWRPALAASMTLALGVLLGLGLPIDSYLQEELTAEEEFYLMAIASDVNEETAYD